MDPVTIDTRQRKGSDAYFLRRFVYLLCNQGEAERHHFPLSGWTATMAIRLAGGSAAHYLVEMICASTPR